MLTEYDIRRRMTEIERSSIHPLRKARKLLAMARKVRMDVRKISHCVAILSRDCMEEQADRMRKAMQRLVRLNREVRDVAKRALIRARQTRVSYDAPVRTKLNPLN